MKTKASLPIATSSVIPEKQLLDFYQRLRLRITSRVIDQAGENEKSTGKPQPLTLLIGALTFLPDLFHLGIRLLLDPKVPAENKGALLAVLIYVMSPIDLIPDIIPISGWVDDLVVLVIGLNKFLETENPEVRAAIDRHWVGDDNAIKIIKHLLDITDQAVEFLPKKLMRMMKDIFRS